MSDGIDGPAPQESPDLGAGPLYAPHRITDVDLDSRTGTCSVCGPGAGVRVRHRRRDGSVSSWRCSGPQREGYEKNRITYASFKKLWCERDGCPHEVDYACLLDVHHIDGNNNNHDPSNLMTLCAFCHRLVTFRVIEL